MVVDMACSPEPLSNSAYSLPRANCTALALTLRSGTKPPQLLSPFQQILGFGTVQRRAIEGRFDDFFVGDRNVEATAELAQLPLVQFLLLMGDVAAFAGFAQAVAFDGLGKNNRGPAFVFHRGLVGGVNFLRIVAAAQQVS